MRVWQALRLHVLLPLLTTGSLGAQEVNIHAARAWSSVLQDPFGVGAAFTPIRAGRVEARAGYAYLRGSERDVGVPCWEGLGEPCPVEELRRKGSLHQARLSVPVALLSRPRVRLLLVPSGHIDHVSSTTEGLQTGRGSSHAQRMWGMDVGVEIQLIPRLGAGKFNLGLHHGQVRAFAGEPEADSSHWPEFSLTRIEVGFTPSLRFRG